jgi:hypothetical protein
LHGSSTANIHFHGTHTNPNSTGDNVFLQIRTSPRSSDQFVVNAGTVSGPFAKFFADCETQLKGNALSEWPHTWKDLPSDWTQEQEKLLKAYDAGAAPYVPPPKPAPLRYGRKTSGRSTAADGRNTMSALFRIVFKCLTTQAKTGRRLAARRRSWGSRRERTGITRISTARPR